MHIKIPLSSNHSHSQLSKASAGPPPSSATPPSKKRRLLEDSAEVTNNNIRGHAMTQAASNGPVLMPRPVPGQGGGSASMSSKSLRTAASGASSDLDNYSDIRPDILEMIKEEQKVEASIIRSSVDLFIFQAKLMEPNHNNWSSHSSSANMPGGTYCYQNQLQNMWQKCWNQNANVFQVCFPNPAF